MNRKEKLLLVLSIIASIGIWGAVYGWKFGLVLIVSVLIHEFGHYCQMGREGISKRTMFMLPPFGAIALAKEPWPTRLAETKIALAGPLWGAIPVLVLLFWWRFVQPLPFFMASAAIVAVINLLNLALPVAVLDGGRVIKSVLFSWRSELGLMFYPVSFIVLAILVLYIPSFLFFLIALLLLFALNNERASYLLARSELEKTRKRMAVSEKLEKWLGGEEQVKAMKGFLLWLQKELVLQDIPVFEGLAEKEKELRLVAEPAPMTKQQIATGLAVFFALDIFYLGVVSRLFNALNIKGGSIFDFSEQLFNLIK